MKVSGKIIVVTGGGSGMGRELVLDLLSKGAKVIAVDIKEKSLKVTAELAGSKRDALRTEVVNIADKDAVFDFVSIAPSIFGAVDGIINNAGIIQPFIKLKDLPYEDIERVLNINLWGTLYMTKAFLPHLLSRPEAHIINISSMGGFLPVPGQTIYGASKAAVKLLTEGLNCELENTNVNVTVVFPGAIHTQIMENSGLENQARALSKSELARLTTPQKAAGIIIDGMENNKYRVLIGRDSKFLDLFYRWSPKSAAAFITKKMKRV